MLHGLQAVGSNRVHMRAQSLMVVAMCAHALASCTLPLLPDEQLALPAPIVNGWVVSERGAVSTQPPGLPLSASAASGTTKPRVYKGTGDFSAEAEVRVNTASGETKDGITLNLVGASITEVAKTVLGDVLGVNYVVSDKVKGNITLHTVRPVSKAGLIEIFDAVLRAEGAALVVDAGVYRIIPSSDAAAAGAPLRQRGSKAQPGAGVVTEIVPLQYVSAQEIERVLKSAAPQAGILRVDTARNLIMLSGTRAEIASMVEMIEVFDVDWMRGMSFGIFPIETADPEAIAQELDVIFANDKESPTKGIVRFVPNRRLKSLLVITSRPEYMKKAQVWLSRIDMASKATEKRVHVYHVQHRPANELAQLLQRVYSSNTGSRVTTTATTSRTSSAPAGLSGGDASRGASDGVSGTGISSGGLSGGGGGGGVATQAVQPPPAPSFGTTSVDPVRNAPDAGRGPDAQTDAAVTSSSDTARSAAFGNGLPPEDRAAGISVVADDPNNSLVITATPSEYKRMKEILQSIDIAPNQLLIEATIAEITLNDQLKLGLRFFFEKGATKQLSFTDANVAAVSPVAAGFNFFLSTTNLQVVLNALSTVTDVNVVSSPTLMVLENKKATLQVGNEVPIATQQAVGVLVAGAPIVNSVSFRSTGVILGITPRVSDDGNVLLDIEQEVSDAVPTITSGIDSPTIQQRRVKTTVSVRDGETIVLAGFMQDRASRARDQVPILGDLPIFGNAFKNKTDGITRTELVIAITPRVVKDSRQIAGITAEYRDKLNFNTRPQRAAGPDIKEQLDRLAK